MFRPSSYKQVTHSKKELSNVYMMDHHQKLLRSRFRIVGYRRCFDDFSVFIVSKNLLLPKEMRISRDASPKYIEGSI